MPQDWPTSPLDALETAWTALTRDPSPLSLDLGRVDPALGLPPGTVALPLLRDWLIGHPEAHTAHDVVWTALIERARAGDPAWVVGTIGMALPALRRYAVTLGADYSGDTDDLDAELVAGFLDALRRDRSAESDTAPGARLCWAAWRAALELRRQGREHIPVEDLEQLVGSRAPRVPWGHPDLLVARAAALGLCSAEEALAWIEVRLGWMDPEPVAATLRMTPGALRMRLYRLDQRLAAALADGLLTESASPQARAALQRAAEHRTAIHAGLATVA